MLHCFLCVFIPILFAVRSGFKGISRRRRFGNLRLMVNEKRSFTLVEIRDQLRRMRKRAGLIPCKILSGLWLQIGEKRTLLSRHLPPVSICATTDRASS